MTTDFDKYAGSRIRHFRLLRGFTQTSLGIEMGMSPQQVQKYEYGTNRLSIQTAYRFKLVLGIEWSDFIPSGDVKSLDLATELQHEKYVRLVKNFKTLSRYNQDVIFQLIKYLTEQPATH